MKSPDTLNTPSVTGVLLAGGRARRMGGGDKCLKMLGGKSLLEHTLARAAPQVNRLILNTNSEPSTFSAFNLPIINDSVPGFAGPLAGVLSAMQWAQQHEPDSDWLVSFATDTPFFPPELVDQLLIAAEKEYAQIVVATSKGRRHPVFALWRIDLAEELRHALVDEKVRKIEAWSSRYRVAQVDFSQPHYDPFFNVNQPDDLTTANNLLCELEGTVPVNSSEKTLSTHDLNTVSI